MENYIYDDWKLGQHIKDAVEIPNAHLKSVCKIGCGEKTCRYIGNTMEQKFYFCAKNTPVKAIIDAKVSEGKIKSKGDNCDGF